MEPLPVPADPAQVVLAVAGPPLVRVVATGSTGALLHLVGELDIATAPELASAVEELVGRGRVHLGLDLGGLEFCDVVGLAALVDARRRVEACGGSVEVLRPSPLLQQLARWCGEVALVPA